MAKMRGGKKKSLLLMHEQSRGRGERESEREREENWYCSEGGWCDGVREGGGGGKGVKEKVVKCNFIICNQ